MLLNLFINCLKSVVSNLRLLLVGSPLRTDYKAIVGSFIRVVVEETIISFYSKGLLLYYKKSSLV